MTRALWACVLSPWLLSCSTSESPPSGADAPSATPSTSAALVLPSSRVVVAEAPSDAPAAPAPASASPSNPLGLPPVRISLSSKKRVFAVPERMLASAKLGSTFVLYAATALGLEGDDVLVEGSAGGGPYRVHAGYVIPVPDTARLRPQDAVVAEWNGTLRHGLVTRLVKDRIGVRFTDVDGRVPEVLLRDARLIEQSEGLHPGNYVAVRDGETYRHAMLVSALGQGAGRRWLALGFGGAATLVDEADLTPIPLHFAPKNGAEVWAVWVGTMRKGSVQGSPDPGFFSVKLERAGPPITVGRGFLMAPIATPAAP